MAIIPTYNRQEQLAPLPSARVSAAGSEASYGSTVVSAGQGMINAGLKLAQEYEYAKALSAVNEFQKQVDIMHLDPNKGYYSTRQLGNANGMTLDADAAMGDAAKKIYGDLTSPYMRRVFAEQTQKIAISQSRANQKWEAAQIEKFKNNEAEAAITNSFNRIRLYPNDEETFQEELENIMLNADYRYLRGASEEERERVMSKMRNDAAANRFAALLNEDPASAKAWYEGNKDLFLAETREKAEGLIEDYDARLIADEVMQIHGGEFDVYGGVAAIRGMGLKQTLEDRAVKAYNAAWGERVRGYQMERAALAQARSDTSDGFYERLALGQTLSEDEILGSNLTGAQKLNFLRQIRAMEQAAVQEEILEKMGDLGNTEQARSITRMNRLGITQEQHNKAFIELSGLIDDNMSEQQFKYYTRLARDNGRITHEDMVNLNAARKHFSKAENKELVRVMKQDMKIISVFNPNKDANKDIYGMRHKIDPVEYQQILADISAAQAELIANRGDRPANEVAAEFRDLIRGKCVDLYNSLGQTGKKQQEARRMVEAALGGEINIGVAVPAITVGQYEEKEKWMTRHGEALSMQMLGRKITPNTGDFNAPRRGKNGTTRQHAGYDFAAPEGTPIKMTDMFGLHDMHVVTNAHSESYGNYVEIDGVDADGNMIRVRMGHMKERSPLAVGSKVNGGELVGFVGHTGTTSRDIESGGKRNGDHLDIKLVQLKKSGNKVKHVPIDPLTLMQRLELKGAGMAALEYGNDVRTAETFDGLGPDTTVEDLMRFIGAYLR